MKNLFYVRHGESEANLKKISAGHTDVVLSEAGIEQAINAGIELKKSGQKIDLIISSPLKRALFTAQRIAAEINYPDENIIINSDCMERFRGRLEGQPSYLQDNMTEEEYATYGAESEAEVLIRAKRFYEYLKTLKEENILVVSHDRFGRCFVSHLTNVDRTNFDRLPNAHVFKIDIKI